MDAETIKLALDMRDSGKSVDEIVAKLGQLHAAASKVGDEYQVLDRRAGTYSVTTAQVDHATERAVQAAVAQTHAQKALSQALEETTKQGKAAAGMSRDMQMRVLNLGRAAQDLAQGGFPAIINNLEGITGGSGLAAGAITLLGTALLVSKPYWEGWLKQIGEVKTKIPPSTDAVKRLTESLEEDKKALEALKKQGELNYAELERYGKLAAEVAQKEADLAEARMSHAVGPGESKGHKERGAAFREALGEYGGSDKLQEVLQNAGLSAKEAQELHNQALAGIKGAAERARDLTRGMPKSSQFNYQSPDEKRHEEQMKRDGEKHDRILKQQAEHEERQQKAADHKREQDAKKAEHDEARAIQEQVRLGRKVGEAAERGERVGRLDKAEMMPFEPMPGMGAMQGGGGGMQGGAPMGGMQGGGMQMGVQGMPMGGGMGMGMGGDGMPQMGVQGMAGPGMGMMGVHNAQLQAMHGMMGVVDLSHSNQQALIGRYRALASFAETQRQNMVYTRQRMMPMGNYGW